MPILYHRDKRPSGSSPDRRACRIFREISCESRADACPARRIFQGRARLARRSCTGVKLTRNENFPDRVSIRWNWNPREPGKTSSMSLLARAKIITKILAVILLLAAVAVSISWLGIAAMATLKQGADNMSMSAKRALMAAQANQNVIVLSRSEFRIALDPRA